MSIFGTLFGEAAAAPIKAVGHVIDEIFTSDDERLKAEIAKARIAQELLLQQAKINESESKHRSIWVAGWRPAIGWTCALGLFYDFVFRPIMNGFGFSFVPLDSATLVSLVTGMLGFGALRTLEKFGGKTK